MDQQLLTSGVVAAIDQRNPQLAIVRCGPWEVKAMIPSKLGNVRIGESFHLYKVKNMYFLGTKVRNS